MRTSPQKLAKSVEKEILHYLFLVFADAKNPAEVEEMFRGILTEAELISVAKRIAAAKYLEDGLSYGEIKNRLNISSATVSQIQAQAPKNLGFQIALNKIKEDEWASKWEKRIKNWLRIW